MVVSDPYHAAQIRQPAAEGRGKVHRFDDFGCAVIWLDEQEWRDHPEVEFWVTDHRTGEWIDASKAVFVQGRITPMEYGLGAQGDSEGVDGMSFKQAREHVYDIDRRFNAHHHRTDGTGVPSPNESAGTR
jgi:hypothetical protein